MNGDGSQNSRSGTKRPTRTPRECTFKDFLNCQPLTFKGTEGVGLTQWFEKMESVFHISNCTVENQVKFATCTLLDATLKWWNSHVKTVSHNAAYGLPWKTHMKMIAVKYYPKSEIKKLEIEIWNLKVKGTDVVGYTQHFQELALMCGRMFPEESDEVENASAPPGHRALCKCPNCKKVGHLTMDCWIPTTANNKRTITCYECGNQGHYKSDYPEPKGVTSWNSTPLARARYLTSHWSLRVWLWEEKEHDPRDPNNH
ncbi:reverse transcriptase domain-containing protein [Tanacetum coccineum]|uniref:Reverse transcriptase domain-containing protein n=1 Tax=Tanacetum coccineum TaxID=301880 RepID=A0ABQ5BM15_9ASTR